MRLSVLSISVAATLAAFSYSKPLRADSMDPALERLVLDERCRSGRADGQGQFYNPVAGFDRCQANNAAFGKLVAQLGFALAPTATHSARTTGYGGYKISVQGAYTTIDSNASYWIKGTQGPTSESSNKDSVENRDPSSMLQVYSLKLAKGFPFGLELGASFGYLVNTNIIVGGGDVRLALFEGFRESVPGFLPDVGVGGGVRTITGAPQLKLTVASFDAQISKPIPIAGTVVVQPHVGYQWVRIFGDSGLVDLTPNTDATQLCGYQGDNNPGNPDPNKQGFDGQPVCQGSAADFNNNVVFNNVRLTRHRINFGAQLRYQMLHFGVHAITDLIDPVSANDEQVEVVDPADPSGRTKILVNRFDDDPRTSDNDAVTSQWTVAVEIGAVF